MRYLYRGFSEEEEFDEDYVITEEDEENEDQTKSRKKQKLETNLNTIEQTMESVSQLGVNTNIDIIGTTHKLFYLNQPSGGISNFEITAKSLRSFSVK